MNLEVANERGESQGSLLNSVPALVQFYHWLNKAWISVMWASSVQTSVASLPCAGSVCDQPNLTSIMNVTCLISYMDWESRGMLNPHLPVMLQCSDVSKWEDWTHTHQEARDGFASKTVSVFWLLHSSSPTVLDWEWTLTEPELPPSCKA